jgi:predicted ribosome quality control (RQC) complex YloA/Tae2 family protein
MTEELERARQAPVLRQVADGLMLLGDAPAPAELPLQDGSHHATGAAPGEMALDAAHRLYRDVRAMERALQVLPARLAALRETDERVAHPAPSTNPARRAAEADSDRAFRTYRSSGGLDIWVGRGAAWNDQLTFRVASPDDVWLHARDAAGAHVVLRWRRPEPPPARDLEEAALLAAWHSRARHSTLVPVDWTRRKYVRKPRGGAPGLVVVQRCQTVMVRPDGEAERRLREGRGI